MPSPRSLALGAGLVLVPALVVAALYHWRSKKQGSKDGRVRRILILYGTCTGTAKKFAYRVERRARQMWGDLATRVVNVKEYNEETLHMEDVVLFLCSTWTDGTAPESAQPFLEFLREYMYDFRVSKNHLESLDVAVFGLGGVIYGDNYAKAAKDAHNYLTGLGATALLPVHCGDDQTNLEAAFEDWCDAVVPLLGSGDATPPLLPPSSTVTRNRPSSFASTTSSASTATRQSKANLSTPRGNAFQRQQLELKRGQASSSSAAATAAAAAAGAAAGASSSGSKAVGPTPASGEDEDDEEEEEDRINSALVALESAPAKAPTSAPAPAPAWGEDEEDEEDEEEEEEEEAADLEDGTLDVEDLGGAIRAQSQQQSQRQEGVGAVRHEMVTKLQRKALTKEGYRIIGSHSAVKLCRWTKAQMRGRGGCYKHTFYGITSYQCMEATPSLACANKCVFCWRHHKNPVGTDWRWKEDEPRFIVDEAVLLHQSMINEMRGVPGVLPERLQEGFTVKHCALSLVGEPIMYPRINEMLRCLHDRQISSFMVTNAQFPERIKQLDPVTQLYVSIDASTKDSLKAIDRPLFQDFWERFLGCLKELRLKKQRTVFRMTLVKAWNMDDEAELQGYAELVEMGMPDFIEIKAMTYCGKSDASSLTMQNVPWHREVCTYGDNLARVLRERGVAPTSYSIATEHEHSCCILLAREDKFKPQGVWHTWIDYPRFHELEQEYYKTGALFSSEDYYLPTPEWALYQSQTHGFDPTESRFRKNKAGAIVEVEYKSSESGCG